MLALGEMKRSHQKQHQRVHTQISSLRTALQNTEGVTDEDYARWMQEHTHAVAQAICKLVTNDQINMKDISYEMVQQEAENQLQHDYDADYFEVAYGDTMSRMTKLAVDTVKSKRKRKLDMQLARVTSKTIILAIIPRMRRTYNL
eukprot:SAG11_NODE_15618_length_571_cov_3.449153_1_plen_145_part_00